jgi:hypothetical protein|tara:strand:+ start:2301 stop:2621 length:321 start_codon:yes stop_codon:yes gene_type:complete
MAKKAKSITVISDPLMEPYYITKDDLCYTVNERITPNKDHFRSKGVGTEYAKPQGYYASFELALVKISEELMHTKRNYDSLSEYIEEYRIISNQIKEYTDGIRSTV